MWTLTLRDLEFRRRQFAIAVVGAGLAFALTLVLTGMSAGFRHEAQATVDALNAGAWVVPRGVSGPFTSQSTVPVAAAEEISGGGQIEPLATFTHVAHLLGDDKTVTVVGHSIGGLGDAQWGQGSAVPSGQVVVDKRLGVDEGEAITIGSSPLRVVGVAEDRTAFGGQPLVFVSLAQAQQIGFAGEPVANALLTRTAPTSLPRGLTALTDREVRDDMLRPLDGAVGSIDFMRLLMWILAAVVIASITYLSTLERLRDLAVLKAVGSSPRRLMASLAVEAVVTALVAAALGAAVAQILAPGFPLPVTIETSAYLALPVVAVIVGVIASLTAIRRAMRIDPAAAFAGV
jgi:putative ABC transport system permease protein